MRFHPGSKSYKNFFCAEIQPQDLVNVISGMEFSLIGIEKPNIYASHLAIDDQESQTLHFKRFNDQLICLKNNQPFKPKLDENPIERILMNNFQGIANRPLKLSSFSIVYDKGTISYVPFNKLNNVEKDIGIYKFLSIHLNNLHENMTENFSSDKFDNEADLLKFGKSLDKLYQQSNELDQQYETLYRDKVKQPVNTTRIIQELQDQLAIMDRIEIIINNLTQSQTPVCHLKKEYAKVEEQLERNLHFCGLVSVPNLKKSLDWNTPLQCICYINVLEKLLPVLTDSIETFNKHFLTASNLKNDEDSFDQLIESVHRKLQSVLNNMENLDQQAVSTEQDHSNSWYVRLHNFLANEKNHSESHQSKSVHYSKIQTSIKLTLDYLDSLQEKPSKLVISAKPLESLLESTQEKLDNLRSHWRKICSEYNIPENKTMHDLLQYILKFNELYILQQKHRELQEEICNKNRMLRELKKILITWFEKNSSQKVTPLNNTQIILNEAHNIIRYKKDKEKKLKELQTFRLDIEVNNKIKKNLAQRRKTITKSWSDLLESYHLKVISLKDERVKQFTRTFSDFQVSLSLQKKNFPRYLLKKPQMDLDTIDPICIWYIDSALLPRYNKIAMTKFICSLPASHLHIFCSNDSKTLHSLSKVGLGKIQINKRKTPNRNINPSTISKTMTANLRKERTERPILNTTDLIPNPNPKEIAQLQTNILESKAQAVVDLLNGNKKPRI